MKNKTPKRFLICSPDGAVLAHIRSDRGTFYAIVCLAQLCAEECQQKFVKIVVEDNPDAPVPQTVDGEKLSSANIYPGHDAVIE